MNIKKKRSESYRQIKKYVLPHLLERSSRVQNQRELPKKAIPIRERYTGVSNLIYWIFDSMPVSNSLNVFVCSTNTSWLNHTTIKNTN
ncbi:uncharacterized protein B0P05DRAFT_558200 [Gilbertella persicaria]|uniref:uncharacterized protein n=1 Tax=Gilbertella persicaria TaxID=101096 RepID=UPI002221265A|nr:uncharacterized protein B0P05DRAFT_558200 [Gilbertella persicaria]KAI8059952.1 hypothetical protein B0P05DRAFT_558200 [Gilbertella persicaria]